MIDSTIEPRLFLIYRKLAGGFAVLDGAQELFTLHDEGVDKRYSPEVFGNGVIHNIFRNHMESIELFEIGRLPQSI